MVVWTSSLLLTTTYFGLLYMRSNHLKRFSLMLSSTGPTPRLSFVSSFYPIIYCFTTHPPKHAHLGKTYPINMCLNYLTLRIIKHGWSYRCSTNFSFNLIGIRRSNNTPETLFSFYPSTWYSIFSVILHIIFFMNLILV